MDSFNLCSEDWDRTNDLRVMSPTSYRCSTSQFGCKDTPKPLTKQTTLLIFPTEKLIKL